MVKMIAFLKRNPSLTREEFSRHWREKHAPLVMGVPEFRRYLRKYTQCHIASNAGPVGAAADCDGVAELWFDSADDLAKAFSEPRYLEIIRPDEKRMLDFDKVLVCVTEEISIC
jgi:uncharacterized protein (TIGR02118 family)